MRVLVLGGTGFLGSATERALCDHDVVTASRSSPAQVVLDAEDERALDEHLRSDRYDAVVNLIGAGLSAETADAATMRRINSELPARILETLAKLASPPHLIHAASSTERLADHVVHESEYSRSKFDGTVALKVSAAATGTPVTILTVHNTYGPGQPERRFVASVIAALATNEPVALNYPNRVRDFVFVSDAAASIRFAVEHASTGLSTAEVGTGIGITLRESALVIASALGKPEDLVTAASDPPPDPNPVTVAAVRFGTYGLCTTEFDDGVRRVLEGS